MNLTHIKKSSQMNNGYSPVGKGFTLIEIAIVLVIVTLLAAIVAPLAIGQAEASRRATTKARMDNVDKALILFVQRNQRLPCPADGSLDNTSALNGVENRNPLTGDCNGNQQTGVVPSRSLGLGDEDVTDGRNLRFTFRIGQYLARNNSLNMTMCDPIGTFSATGSVVGPGAFRVCANTCTSITPATCTSVVNFLGQFGLTVADNVTGAKITDADSAGATTGAAYALISHGNNQGGAYTTAGVLATASPASGSNEAFNHNNQVLRIPPLFYSEGNENNAETPAHFDDVVRHPTVQSLIDAAGLSPRVRP
jgi:prepilin-type N-terminal cleavage/methylation domain-containing protein